MTDTQLIQEVARSCGWQFDCDEAGLTHRHDASGFWVPFHPLTQWGDAMAAAEASGLLDPVEHGFILRRDKAAWVVESGDGQKIIGADRSGPRALCLAIVAILQRSLWEQHLASRANRDDFSWPEPECVVHARA